MKNDIVLDGSEENKICFSNMWFTATIGYLLCWFMYPMDPIKLVFMLLFYPASFFITKLFLRCKIKTRFMGFIVGAMFSFLGTAVILAVSSVAGEINWITSEGLDFLGPIYYFIATVMSLLVGGIAGVVIIPGKHEHH